MRTDQSFSVAWARYVDELPAGPEMDALVSDRVMRIPPDRRSAERYSSDEAASELVKRKLGEMGLDSVSDGPHPAWQVLVIGSLSRPSTARAETRPLALCRAALKALTW
ncbi:MAG TPA: hypothetical protein VIA45_15930 [Thermoanaerobaculia bacterium]